MAENNGVETNNSFEPVAPEDNDKDDPDNEEEMIQHLKTLAHKVEVQLAGPRLSQSEKRARAKAEAEKQCTEQKARKPVGPPKPLTKKQIRDIVNAINSGQLKLPDLDLENMGDSDLITIWALMDSGSAVHVADVEKHFPNAKVRISESQKGGSNIRLPVEARSRTKARPTLSSLQRLDKLDSSRSRTLQWACQ